MDITREPTGDTAGIDKANKASWAFCFYPQGIKPEHDEAVQLTRDAFADCAMVLQQRLPEGRYKAMVKSHLEEAAAMATKAFTHA